MTRKLSGVAFILLFVALLGMVVKSSERISGSSNSSLAGNTDPLVTPTLSPQPYATLEPYYYAWVTLRTGEIMAGPDVITMVEKKYASLPYPDFLTWAHATIDGGLLTARIELRSKDLPIATLGWTNTSRYPSVLVLNCADAPNPGPVYAQIGLSNVACINGSCLLVGLPNRFIASDLVGRPDH